MEVGKEDNTIEVFKIFICLAWKTLDFQYLEESVISSGSV